MGNKLFPAVTFPFGNDENGGEGRNPGTDVNHSAAGKVESSQFSQPASGAPNPVCQWSVNQGGPQDNEDQQGAKFHPFGEGAGN